MLKIGITGHRDLFDISEVGKSIYFSLLYFQEFDKNLLGITALATGADTIFAKEVSKIGAPLRIMVPFDINEYKKDFKRATERSEFEKLLTGNPGGYEVYSDAIPRNQEQRNEAYFDVGKKIVDESDIVLAVWDGEPAAGLGGTGDIVAYARSQGKEVHIINAVRGTDMLVDEADELFRKLDTQAVKFKNRFFEPIWLTGLVTGVLAVICFASALLFFHESQNDEHDILHSLKFVFAIFEIFFLLLSFVLLVFFANKWKHRFLESRREAEYLRSLIWFKSAKIPITPLSKVDITDESVSINFRKILEIERQLAKSISKIDSFQNAKRMLWCLAEEQVAYHEKKRIHRFKQKEKVIHVFLSIVKVAFFVAVIFKFVLEFLEFKHILNPSTLYIKLVLPILMFLIIVLPSLYAVLEGIKYFGDWKRNIKVSQKTVGELKSCKKRIVNTINELSLIAEGKILRQILELENTDWVVQYIEKEIEAKV